MQLTKINVTRIELLNKGREPIEQTCYDRIMNVVQWIDVTYVDNDNKDWKIFLRYHPLLQELLKYSCILEI